MSTSNATGGDAPRRRETDTSVSEGLPEEFPKVVAFEGSTRADLYEQWVPGRIGFERPESLSAARDILNESVAVVLVRHELSAGMRRSIHDLLDKRTTECRVLLTTSGRSPVADDIFDAEQCLSEPIDREKFADAVSRQVHLVAYAMLLKRYYETTAAVASLEVELDDRARSEDEQYKDLSERVTCLKAQLDTLRRHLDPEDVKQTLIGIVPPAFEREANERPASDSKYRPNNCHKCGRDWNVNPDGSRAGYKRLSSFVWKCDKCGTIYDRSAPTNNQIEPRT